MNTALSTQDMRSVNALLDGRGELHYQPVLRTQGGPTIAFHEALLRLRDETGAILPPDVFIPVARRAGIIAEVDALALDLAVRILDRSETLRLSVNMDPENLTNPIIQARIAALPSRIADRMILEVTEASQITDAMLIALRSFRATGLTVLIDDFGAGYSSVRHFLTGAFDGVKLDWQLIHGVADDHDRQAICRALISIAQHFDLMVVAEGVETKADADWLIDAGADALQGFLFGRPTDRPGKLLLAEPFLRRIA
ncbi:EAL domain-containing protein [Rubricella aquisinus]|nr:EAL domain-containing protein [Rubricella aquisinus]